MTKIRLSLRLSLFTMTTNHNISRQFLFKKRTNYKQKKLKIITIVIKNNQFRSINKYLFQINKALDYYKSTL